MSGMWAALGGVGMHQHFTTSESITAHISKWTLFYLRVDWIISSSAACRSDAVPILVPDYIVAYNSSQRLRISLHPCLPVTQCREPRSNSGLGSSEFRPQLSHLYTSRKWIAFIIVINIVILGNFILLGFLGSIPDDAFRAEIYAGNADIDAKPFIGVSLEVCFFYNGVVERLIPNLLLD